MTILYSYTIDDYGGSVAATTIDHATTMTANNHRRPLPSSSCRVLSLIATTIFIVDASITIAIANNIVDVVIATVAID